MSNAPHSTQWTFGKWTLTAERHDDSPVTYVRAYRYTKRDGTRHGAYAVSNGDVMTVSMADAKVNAHMRTAKVARILATLDDCAACGAEPGEPCRDHCIARPAR